MVCGEKNARSTPAIQCVQAPLKKDVLSELAVGCSTSLHSGVPFIRMFDVKSGFISLLLYFVVLLSISPLN